MKIVDNQKENCLTFKELNQGDVFSFEGCARHYMKTETFEYVSSPLKANAVCFEDGRLTCFFDHDEVVKLTATLTIE